MALKIKSTFDEDAFSHVNAIIYGQAGIGKTVLCSTAPSPLILSAEDGLLSLAGKQLDYIKISCFKDLIEAYNGLLKEEHPYQTVCIDSLSELAETFLAERKKEERDPRRAYGDMADEIIAAVRKFKKLPLHTFFIAKQGRIEDQMTGKQSFGPAFPGKVLQDSLPYQVDLLFAMRLGKHEGKEFRYLQTTPDIQYEAKDRSGVLSSKEKPDLTSVILKIKDHANHISQSIDENTGENDGTA